MESFRQKVAALTELVGSREAFNMILAPMRSSMSKLSPALAKLFDDEFSFDALLPEIVDAYAKYYDESDIDDLTAFYKTSAGSKFVKFQPQIQAEMMTFGQQRAERVFTPERIEAAILGNLDLA